MDYFLVYLWTRLDTIQNTLGFFAVVGTLFWIAITAFSYLIAKDRSITYDEDRETSEEVFNFCKNLTPLVIFIMILWLAIPSQKDFALIYVLPQIAHNKTVQSIGTQSLNVPDKLLKLANTKLDELLQIAVKEEVSDNSSKDTKR